jgi:hypothetical protein
MTQPTKNNQMRLIFAIVLVIAVALIALAAGTRLG